MRLTATIKYARWVWPYINALRTFAYMAGMDPDVDKAIAVAMRGVRVTIATER